MGLFMPKYVIRSVIPRIEKDFSIGLEFMLDGSPEEQSFWLLEPTLFEDGSPYGVNLEKLTERIKTLKKHLRNRSADTTDTSKSVEDMIYLWILMSWAAKANIHGETVKRQHFIPRTYLRHFSSLSTKSYILLAKAELNGNKLNNFVLTTDEEFVFRSLPGQLADSANKNAGYASDRVERFLTFFDEEYNNILFSKNPVSHYDVFFMLNIISLFKERKNLQPVRNITPTQKIAAIEVIRKENTIDSDAFIDLTPQDEILTPHGSVNVHEFLFYNFLTMMHHEWTISRRTKPTGIPLFSLEVLDVDNKPLWFDLSPNEILCFTKKNRALRAGVLERPDGVVCMDPLWAAIVISSIRQNSQEIDVSVDESFVRRRIVTALESQHPKEIKVIRSVFELK